MKNKKTIILLLLIAIVGVVGLTLAYFANTASVENEFNTKQYGTTVDEVFTSPSDWTPGTTTPKTLTVTNSGQVDEAVRVSYTESWTSANSNVEGDLELSQGNNRAAIINFTNSSDWTPVTESDNKTYYYYNYKLTPGETTSTLLDSVTFNKDIVNANNCVETKTATGKKVECTSDGAGYDGATYKLVFKVETVQYDKYGEAWNTNKSIASMKPMTVQQFVASKTNASTVTSYNDASADKGKMFTFSHPKTEQMKATTDYRYIGNVPNNYVKFNCDNDGTNCEMWRIIGVFDVDNGNGTYEQRIKLVRERVLPDEIKWDDRYGSYEGSGTNEWKGSKINNFLNDNYLNKNGVELKYGLKPFAQSQIAETMYYLAGIIKNGQDNFGSAEDMYNYERGNIVYNENGATRNTYWRGLVALMYPSDYTYTYANEVDELCYSNAYMCFEPRNPLDLNGYPTRSWVYNSNLDIEKEWLLTPFSTYVATVMQVSHGGSLINYGYAQSSYGVRPVVYLKSSIQITGGDGSELNPYTLSS